MNGSPDEISLCNAALARFGGGAILDFAEETDLAATVAALYPTAIDAILQRHHWRRLDKTTALQRREAAPDNGYAYAFDFPSNAVTDPRILLEDPRRRIPLRDFTIEGRTVCTDKAAIWGTFGYRLSPDQWSPALRQLVLVALAAEFCIAVCEDKELAQIYRAEAFGSPQQMGQGGLFAIAIGADHAAGSAQAPLDAGFTSGYTENWLSAP